MALLARHLKMFTGTPRWKDIAWLFDIWTARKPDGGVGHQQGPGSQEGSDSIRGRIHRRVLRVRKKQPKAFRRLCLFEDRHRAINQRAFRAIVAARIRS